MLRTPHQQEILMPKSIVMALFRANLRPFIAFWHMATGMEGLE